MMIQKPHEFVFKESFLFKKHLTLKSLHTDPQRPIPVPSVQRQIIEDERFMVS